MESKEKQSTELECLRAFKRAATDLYRELRACGIDFAAEGESLPGLVRSFEDALDPCLEIEWGRSASATTSAPVEMQDLIALAELCLKFARVERATRHEDGKRPETDSDHTVMLGILACAYAARAAPHLDLGKIAQFASVHDFVESYSGDVFSLGISADARVSKEAAEHAALERIRSEFSALPWVAATIAEYEALASEEARFVKIMDKVMPKLTHLLNGGVTIREKGLTFEKAHADHLAQKVMMTTEYPQKEALALFDLLIAECARSWELPADC